MNDIIYVGIDPGLSPTIAIMQGKKVVFRVAHNIFEFEKGYKPTDADKWRRINSVYGSVASVLNFFWGQKIVGLERVSFGEKFRVAEMAKIEHVLVGLLLDRSDINNFYVLAPNTVKKLATGHGHMNKKDLREVLGKKYKAVLKTDNLNVSDSLAILLAAKETHGQKNNKNTK